MRVYLLKKVENIDVKGEIACFEEFILLSQCFQRSSAAEASESGYMWEGHPPKTFIPQIYKYEGFFRKQGVTDYRHGCYVER